MTIIVNSTGSVLGYGIRSDVKKAADRSAAFYSARAALTLTRLMDAPYYSSFAPRMARLRSFSVR